MATILLVGCGDIGSHLGVTLAAAGHHCFGLKRNANSLPAAITPIRADVTDADSLRHLPPALDYLVYSVAASGFDADTYHKVYVEGLANTLQALTQQAITPRRILFVSSTATYHQRDGEWVDETSATEPSSFSGQSMLAAEKRLTDSAFTGTSVRFSGIYGPGRERLLQWVRQGVFCSSTPPHYSNRIHRDDCVGVLQHLIEQDLAGQPLANLYIASDPTPSPFHEVLGWLRSALQIRTPLQSDDLAKRIRTGSKRCNSQRLQDSGYHFRYPSYREGFRERIQAEIKSHRE